MKLFLGADHRGFQLKQHLKQYLESSNLEYQDATGDVINSSDDYPVIAQNVAQFVLDSPDTLGVIMCGSGAGIDIAANKIDGIRCVLGINAEQVQAARNDDNVNMLAIAADYTTPDTAVLMVDAFIHTPYNASEKHNRRLSEIEEIEKSS